MGSFLSILKYFSVAEFIMKKMIGIRREDKNIWERRVPLIPEHTNKLFLEHGIQTVLQPFERRAFGEQEYIDCNAEFNEDLSECPIVIAVKEIPIPMILKGKTYMFFSHTIKGQSYNMPLLQKIIESKSTLIDYECIKNEEGKRLVFFGHFAGVVGMIDTLHGLGKRLKSKGLSNPLEDIKPAYAYKDIYDAKAQLKIVADRFKDEGMPDIGAPYVFGYLGYGNVSKGAQEILDIFPLEEINPDELSGLKTYLSNKFYKAVFKEKHLVKTIDPNDKFDLLDYFNNPEKYESKFENYIPYLSVILNCIYWNEKYPRFVTKEYLKSQESRKLEIICDITCDINGAIEITYKSTPSDNPAYVYNPNADEYMDGYSGDGVVNIAVDNLPTELPKSASIEFSNSLFPLMPGIVNADLSLPFSDVNYPPEVKRAVVVYKGDLTPNFEYLKEFLYNLI